MKTERKTNGFHPTADIWTKEIRSNWGI